MQSLFMQAEVLHLAFYMASTSRRQPQGYLLVTLRPFCLRRQKPQ